MSIAKMSAMHNSNRYFTVAVDEYRNSRMKGRIYQEEKNWGVKFNNFLELLFYMNDSFDQMAYPMQTMELRSFYGKNDLCPELELCDRLGAGERATFQICVAYRYHASWQGELIWLEQQRRERFESMLQMMKIMEEILITGKIQKEVQLAGTCQISVHSFEERMVTGSVQSAAYNYLEGFSGIISLADVMGEYADRLALKDSGDMREENCKIVTERTWKAYREGGNLATFVVKIMYEEYNTCQGVIFWKEAGKKRAFRSFMELIYLVLSALTAMDGFKENGRRLLREG